MPNFTRVFFTASAITVGLGLPSLSAEDPLAAEPTSTPAFVLQSVEDKFLAEIAKADAEVAKAEAEAVKAKKTAAAARLMAYKDRLAEVTKSGDFGKALAVKQRVDQLEKEPVGVATDKPAKRPRPKDTVKFQGHAYALIKDPATWHVAKQRCEEMGGHLACLENNDELEFALNLMAKSENEAWIGATDEEKETDWKWVTGQPVSPAIRSRFTINNSLGIEDCLVIGGARNVDDISGSNRRWFVCEWSR